MDASESTTYFWVERDEAVDPPAIRARGELDAGSSGELLAVIDTAVADGLAVVLDLAGVTFIDSSGIRALAETARRAESEGGTVRITAASDAVQRLLEMTGLAALVQP